MIARLFPYSDSLSDFPCKTLMKHFLIRIFITSKNGSWLLVIYALYWLKIVSVPIYLQSLPEDLLLKVQGD